MRAAFCIGEGSKLDPSGFEVPIMRPEGQAEGLKIRKVLYSDSSHV
jgi:hypothetical protein